MNDNIIDKFFDFFVRLIIFTLQSIWGGFFWLALGIFTIWRLYRQRKTRDIWNDPMYGFGWIGAVGAILLGLVVVYWHLTGGIPE